MDLDETAIEGVLVVRPRRFSDERGFFSEVFRQDMLATHGIAHEWTQDNHSLSRTKGVVRGLHFQAPPMAQAKLVRVVRGSIFDVAVDLRVGSVSYGKHVGVELSAANWTQLYIPAGFAHGFCAQEDNTEVLYKVAGPYDPASEGGLRWDDPDLAIAWPVAPSRAIMNDRDRTWPPFADFASPFVR